MLRQGDERDMVNEKMRTDVPMEPQQYGGQAACGTIRPDNDYLLREIFQYHPPSRDQQKCYENIREAAKHFASVLLLNTPDSADRSAALRKVREAVMTANAAVALHGLNF